MWQSLPVSQLWFSFTQLAAGIQRVVCIEPYPKSLASELYPNAIRVDERVADEDALDFDAFVGIAPRRFMQWFHAPRRRKDELGYSVQWKPSEAEPRFHAVSQPHLDMEAFLSEKLEKFATELGLT